MPFVSVCSNISIGTSTCQWITYTLQDSTTRGIQEQLKLCLTILLQNQKILYNKRIYLILRNKCKFAYNKFLRRISAELICICNVNETFNRKWATEKLKAMIGKFGVNDDRILSYEELEKYYKEVKYHKCFILEYLQMYRVYRFFKIIILTTTGLFQYSSTVLLGNAGVPSEGEVQFAERYWKTQRVLESIRNGWHLLSAHEHFT